MTLGQRIRKRREELGLTQSELAARLGYKSKVAISHAENDRDDMTTTRILKYANALETTPAYLMGWTETEPYSKEWEQKRLLTIRTRYYGMRGYEHFHIIDVLDALPYNGVREMLSFCDYMISKYDIKGLMSKDDIDKQYVKDKLEQANERAKGGSDGYC